MLCNVECDAGHVLIAALVALVVSVEQLLQVTRMYVLKYGAEYTRTAYAYHVL